MENILKVFLMAFPEWLAVIFMVVGLVVTALAAVRLGYGLVQVTLPVSTTVQQLSLL